MLLNRQLSAQKDKNIITWQKEAPYAQNPARRSQTAQARGYPDSSTSNHLHQFLHMAKDTTSVCSKNSNVKLHPDTKAQTDTGYQGIQRLHANTELPKKKSKKQPLSQEDKRYNRRISSERVVNEHVIGALKRFKIIADKYRNRRKRFGLRFNLIAGIYNLEQRF